MKEFNLAEMERDLDEIDERNARVDELYEAAYSDGRRVTDDQAATDGNHSDEPCEGETRKGQ